MVKFFEKDGSVIYHFTDGEFPRLAYSDIGFVPFHGSVVGARQLRPSVAKKLIDKMIAKAGVRAE